MIILRITSSRLRELVRKFCAGIAMVVGTLDLVAADAETKPTHVAKITTGGTAADVRFSPDGKTLAIQFNDDNASQMMFWDVETRKARNTIKKLAIVCMDFAFTPDGEGMIYLDVTR